MTASWIFRIDFRALTAVLFYFLSHINSFYSLLKTNYDNGLILPENSNLGFLTRQLTSVIVAPLAENKRLIGKSALRIGREIHILLTLKTPENSLSPII